MNDIQEFYQQTSDLYFELQIKKLLESNHAYVEHSGHYIDPFEGKVREFDLVARIGSGDLHLLQDNFSIKQIILCVEAKNVHELSPVVVGCVRRPRYFPIYLHSKTYNKQTGERSTGEHSFHLENSVSLAKQCGEDMMELLGVEIIQGTKLNKNGQEQEQYRKVRDAEIFTKWAQSVNNAIVQHRNFLTIDDEGTSYFYSVPVLVVPDGRLFKAVDDNGNLTFGQTDLLPYKMDVKHKVDNMPVTVSCFYACTPTGLLKLTKGLRGEIVS
jgi:hypothetical protein